ncbi:unnamed protein product [Blepharisma stoltei]|uniref:F-box domain-containing protein n=1 Tax=Blepharisma stoltei TaxID=1481888 RepID=A0AAU9JTU8_9CILI|nr:unnamed protein product [Blepharisma stoltei]
MEKVPIPILSLILSAVGPFDEVIQLSLVCKKWKHAIEIADHYFSFQGSKNQKSQPGNLHAGTVIRLFDKSEKHQIPWKLSSLDLRNININDTELSKIIILQPRLLKLNLTNNNISLGQLWSSIYTYKTDLQSKDPDEDIEFLLEELRFSNNRNAFLGYESLVKTFTNLKKLYAGNTHTTLLNFKDILRSLKKLEILDVMYCPMLEHLDVIFNELKDCLSGSQLKVIFVTDVLPKVIEFLMGCGIEIVDASVGEMLYELKEEADLQRLEEWLDFGGDVDLMCHPSNNLGKDVWNYPPMQFIRHSTDENLLVETFRILIRHGLDLCYHSNDYEKTLLNVAISAGYTGLADLLIRCGADICPVIFSDPSEIPATTFAASKGDISIFQLFFDHQLQTKNLYNEKYCNPVCATANSGKKEMFSFLLENSVPLFKCPHHPNILISSPDILDMALSPEYSEVFMFPEDLMYEAAQFYIIKKREDLVLMIIDHLLPKGIIDLEKEILEKVVCQGKIGSKIPVIGNECHKPLIVLAAERNTQKLLKRLVEAGFDINSEDHFGWTALISASSCGHSGLLSYLCEHGALINKRDKTARTALHQAAHNGHKQVASELIHFGAALSPVCDGGYTPLDLAELNKQTEVLELLRQFGAAHGVRAKRFCELF